MLMNAKKVFMVVIAMLRVTTRKVPTSAFAKWDLVGTEETAVNVSHLLVYNFSNWATRMRSGMVAHEWAKQIVFKIYLNLTSAGAL